MTGSGRVWICSWFHFQLTFNAAIRVRDDRPLDDIVNLEIVAKTPGDMTQPIDVALTVRSLLTVFTC